MNVAGKRNMNSSNNIMKHSIKMASNFRLMERFACAVGSSSR